MSRDPSYDESTLEAERRVGTVLADKWKLDKLLGVGGMAAVYSATHQNNGKTFALKVLHPTLAIQTDIKKRFLREGYIANKVGHPNAVSIIDDGSDPDGSVFLVMELLEGDSLRGWAEARRGKLSAKELLPHVIDVLDVLAAAHDQGIVHRDLKADNVFITKDNRAKVLDFGVARVLEAEGKTRTGMVMGTPEYMPPEQARGRSELIDGRADLWAVGAMIYRLLSGRYPHEAETPNEVLLLAMTEPAPKLVSAVPDASPKLCTLVDKAMAFDKVDRWADARAMQAAAREALDEIRGREAATTAVTDLATLAVESAKTLQAEPSPKGLWLHDKAAPLAAKEPSAKPKRTKRVALVALVALTALGVGGWFGFRWMRARANDANDVNAALLADAGAPLVATNAAPDASDDATDDGELDIDDENPYADWEGGLASWPAADAGALASKPSPTIKPTTKGVKGTVKKKKR